MSWLRAFFRREWLSLILAAIVAGLGVNWFVAPLGRSDLVVLRHHRLVLEARRDRLMSENTALRTRIDKLSSDKHYLERLIRHELGYVRPGELVYRFTDDRGGPRL